MLEERCVRLHRRSGDGAASVAVRDLLQLRQRLAEADVVLAVGCLEAVGFPFEFGGIGHQLVVVAHVPERT